MTDEQIAEIEARATAAINLDPYAHARTDIPALIAALRAAQARVAELEAAMRIDIDDANNSCAVRDCKSWTERGIVCPNCPCHEVSESARVLGIELASAQKLDKARDGAA